MLTFKQKFETRHDSQYALPKIIEPSSLSRGLQLLVRVKFTTVILLRLPVLWVGKMCNSIIDFRHFFETSGINNGDNLYSGQQLRRLEFSMQQLVIVITRN
jgi:hypothetical protein